MEFIAANAFHAKLVLSIWFVVLGCATLIALVLQKELAPRWSSKKLRRMDIASFTSGSLLIAVIIFFVTK